MHLIHNIHQRTIDGSVTELGSLLDKLSGPDDVIWPVPAWPPLRLNGPLGVGAAGGHGPIRYAVVEYEPGQRIRFEWPHDSPLQGWHEFRIEALPDGRGRVVHELTGSAHGKARLMWPVMFRWLHDALVEDALDNIERATTHRVKVANRWSPWVRILRTATSPRPRAVPVPATALAEFGAADLADGWAVPLAPGAPRTATTWATATFSDPPRWVRAALGLRQALVGLVGIEHGDSSAFVPTAASDKEARFGADATHLVFRGLVLIEDRSVSVVTLARAHNLRGRLYLFVVRRIHPAVIRAMLRRANLHLAARPASR